MFTKIFSHGLSLLLLLSIFLLLVQPETTYASDCGASPGFIDSSIAFLGTATSVDEIDGPHTDYPYIEYKFDVEIVYKGEITSTVVVLTTNDTNYRSRFDLGENHLVFATGVESFYTEQCYQNFSQPSDSDLSHVGRSAILANLNEENCSSIGTVNSTQVDGVGSVLRLDCPYSAGHSFTIEAYNLSRTVCTPESTVSDSQGIPDALTTYTQPLGQWCVQTTAFNDTPLGTTASQAFTLFYEEGVEIGLFSVEDVPLSVTISQQISRGQTLYIYLQGMFLIVVSSYIFVRRE